MSCVYLQTRNKKVTFITSFVSVLKLKGTLVSRYFSPNISIEKLTKIKFVPNCCNYSRSSEAFEDEVVCDYTWKLHLGNVFMQSYKRQG